MRKFLQKGALKLKQFGSLVIAVAIAVLALPIGLIGNTARKAAADVVTGEYDGGTPNVATSAGQEFKLTLNYHREKEDYTGWNLWVWAYKVDGSSYEFTPVTIEDKNWMTVTVTLTDVTPNGDNALGIIVRRSTSSDDWAEKAVSEDIWVPLSRFEEGEAIVYMADNIDELYTNAQDALDHKVIRRVSSAYFRKFTSVRVTFNKGVTDKSIFKLKDSNDNVIKTLVPTTETADPTKNFKVGSRTINIELDENFKIDFTESYFICDDPEGEPDPESNFPTKEINKFDLYDTNEFKELYNYEGELGAQYTAEKTVFTVWSPISANVSVVLYDAGDGGEPIDEIAMEKGEKGEWTATVTGDLNGTYYTYKLTDKAGKSQEVVDPYARSGGKNGVRGMILDLASTDPTGWATQNIPDYGTSAKNMAQAVIWEAQLRDVTIHESSGVSAANRGKFLGLTETGTTNGSGQATALDYLKELGVTQVHFQPLFDFASVDESFAEATYQQDYDTKNEKTRQYNWGYDPLNYNMPEGSYSSDPTDGAVRVKEMKQMIMALHNAGIQVVMDVVYNHVSGADDSNFEALMPGYFFRRDSNGKLYNGSGCGNETASNRYMFRRFMIDSVKYWTEEYKIDGFRFDLMALHDIATMNQLYDELVKINPDVIVYGEGWTAGTSGLDSAQQASLANARKVPNIGFFDDITRDGLKGSVFDIRDTGYASGKLSSEATVYIGAVGGTNALGNSYFGAFGKSSFASSPIQNINYVSAHDNSTLWDKLNASVNKDKETLLAMNRVAATSVMTSQGVAFMLAGEEMLRSKPTTEKSGYDNNASTYLTDPEYYFASNSYKSPDSVNAIDWSLINTNKEMVAFYKELIAIKKTFPQFQLTTATQIKNLVSVCDQKLSDGVACYVVRDPGSDKCAVVMYNMTTVAKEIAVPSGTYSVYVNGDKANAKEALSTFAGSSFELGAYSAAIMVAELSTDDVDIWAGTKDATPAATDNNDGNDGDGSNLGLALGLGIGIPAAVLIAGGAVFGVMYGKKKKGKGGKEQPKSDEAGDKPEEPTDAEANAEEQPQESESNE